ncbi:MAG: beta-galactosidase, partial [Prolixibacteraceae bacterium]|nr:beta-galactosidase [Prolixibacteraceae bacterium]
MKNNLLLILPFIALILFGACEPKPSSKELFNNDWQFTISDASFEEVQQLEQWEAVSLPHSAVIEPKIVNDQWQGICWYRKSFQLPATAKGQRVILRFEGAMNVSEYWVNGQKVKEHLGGYLPAVFDFTEAANFDGENIIYVRLDNTDNPVTGPKPLKILDFNMYGGLYRDAWLMIKNPLHITDPLLASKTASGGVFVTYPEVSKESATVQVQTHVANQGSKAKSFNVLNEIWKDDQLLSSQLSLKTSLDTDTDTEVISRLTLENPALWSPDSPSLYQLKTKIVVNGKVLEEENTTIGIKYLAFENGKLVLNGDNLFLRGVNRHQEYPYVGYALSNEAQYRDA